jgi:hypothetical protein
VLLSRIWKKLETHDDTCVLSDIQDCPNADDPVCQNWADCTDVPTSNEVKQDIEDVLNEIESALDSRSSSEEIDWNFELVDKDGNFGNNFEDIVYEYVKLYTGTKCTASCYGSNSGFKNYCYHYYYHRYVVYDVTIKVTIADYKYKIYDESVDDWKPVTLVFYIEVAADDNNCHESGMSYPCSAICGTDSNCKTTYAMSYADDETPYGTIMDLSSATLPE